MEVIDDRQTGETILDETLKMMKAQEGVERMAINTWIDLLSGEYPSLDLPTPACFQHRLATRDADSRDAG